MCSGSCSEPVSSHAGIVCILTAQALRQSMMRWCSSTLISSRHSRAVTARVLVSCVHVRWALQCVGILSTVRFRSARVCVCWLGICHSVCGDGCRCVAVVRACFAVCVSLPSRVRVSPLQITTLNVCCVLCAVHAACVCVCVCPDATPACVRTVCLGLYSSVYCQS